MTAAKIDLPPPQAPAEAEKCKPLISVPPTYTASSNKTDVNEAKKVDATVLSNANSEENVKLFSKMIQEEIVNFEKELKVAKSKTVEIFVSTYDIFFLIYELIYIILFIFNFRLELMKKKSK